MSKHGRPLGTFQVKVPLFRGKKNIKIELFPATEWRCRYRSYNKNTHPRPPVVDLEGTWWSKRYRLRVDGRWHGVKDKRYTLYTLSEALEFVGEKFKELTER